MSTADTQTKPATGAQLIQMRRDLDAMVFDADGEITPELEAILNDSTIKIEQKIEATARFALSQKHSASVIAEEIGRLTERRDAYLNRAKHATDVRLRALLDTLGKTKVETPLVTVAIQDSPPSLVVDPIAWNQLTIRGLMVSQPQLVRFTPERYEINKEEIKRAVRGGMPVPEGMRIEVGSSVRVR